MCTQDAKPNGTYVIPLGEEQQYLDPKPVGTIPFVGEKMVETLPGCAFIPLPIYEPLSKKHS
ncbi:MAG: hypothetical protein U0T32_10855 [Chitinophagales bacterium]